MLPNAAPIYLGFLLNVALTSLDGLYNTATIYLRALLNVASFQKFIYSAKLQIRRKQANHALIEIKK